MNDETSGREAGAGRDGDGEVRSGSDTFVLNPHLKVIRTSKDEVLVRHGSRSLYSEMTGDPARTGLLGRLLAHARSASSLDELMQAGVVATDERVLAADMIAYLRQRQVLVEPASPLVDTYLDSILARGSATAPLSQARVAILGAGPLGSMIARSLAAARVQRVTVVDDRRASEQLAIEGCLDLPPGTVGATRPLAEALGDYLTALATSEIEARVGDPADADLLREVLGDANIAIVAWEGRSPRLFHAVNEVALECGTPWMTVFLDGSEGIVGPTYLPGVSPCYLEFETQDEATLLRRDELVLYRDHLDDTAAGTVDFILPCHAQIVAGYATTSVIRMLALGHTFTTGRALRIDLERMAVDTADVLRLPRCPACSAGRPSPRHLFL